MSGTKEAQQPAATAESEAASGEGALPTSEGSSSPPPTAEAVTVTDFKCLLLFANTSDYTVNATKKATSENYLFGTGGNVSEAFQDSTYGHYRLVQGDSVILDLTSETASANDSDQMRTLMHNKAKALGYDPVTGTNKPYQRVFFFMPNGVTGISTAWAYVDSIGGAWCHSVYSYNWTGAFFDGHAHENSHNCGLQHSSEGGTEYGDETCVMGFSHSSSSKTAIATLNPVKKAQLGVFDAYTNAKIHLSADSTLDMYPLAISPATQAGTRCVTFAGKDYYIAYMRDIAPYGKIWSNDSGKADKVVVWTNTGFSNRSFLAGTINEGGTYNAGDVIIKFERYGNTSKQYATVSFDLNDGNTKPVANAQSASTSMNMATNITLTGSDADTGPPDTLTYAKVTDPANGVLSGTPPNLTYTPNNNFIGSDSFIFSVNDGLISSFATVSITVTETNQAPVANNQSVNVFYNTAETISLSASDPDGNPLSYSIVSNPGSGSLGAVSGSNVTYTPNTNFSGSDSFTFRVHDGQAYSNTATVSVTVSGSPNTPPTVNAGNDQSVFLSQSAPWTPAEITTQLWLDADDAGTITLNGSTVSQWNDKSGNNRHAGQSTATAQPTHTASGLNGRNVLTFDGTTDFLNVDLNFLSGVSHSAFVVTSNVTGHTDIYGAANGSSGSNSIHCGFRDNVNYRMNYWSHDYNPAITSNFVAAGSILNFVWDVGSPKQIFANGKSEGTGHNALAPGAPAGGGRISNVVGHGYYGGNIAEMIFVTGTVAAADRKIIEGYLAHKWGLEGQLDAGHDYKSAPPGSSGLSVDVDLSSAHVTDPEHTPSTTWTHVGGTGTGSVTFANASVIDTTVTITDVGTYVLRLTADDGYDTSLGEVTITVNSPLPSIYATWSGGTFSKAFNDIDPAHNIDGDGLSNMMEFAFGLDPTANDAGPLAINGSVNGQPKSVKGAGNAMEFYFVRRDDHGTSGSVSYTVQFSTDLGSFTNSGDTPAFVADSTANADYHLVKVPYPAGARFARVQVEFVP
ncbi:MAG: Ig-like domain-containing protein [Akkermansiaceae bacterium]|nr:Ig-like domain-containing protein [Akkermansiaceae bacterium]